VRLNIEKLVYGGDGLARSEGRVVLLPFVLPGEEVEAEVERVKNDLLRGRMVQVLSPSPLRVAPPCPHFQRCGGCQYQHIAYEAQLEQKRDILREVLRRVGKIEYDGEIEIVAGEPWEYRNRARLHIENGAIGYFEFGSHNLCPIGHCPISSPKLNETIGALSRELPNLPRFTTELELFTNEKEVQYLASDRIPAAARALFDGLGTTAPIEYAGFRVSRTSFFQVNRFLIDRLVETAVCGTQGDHAIDLYAGVGLFSRVLTASFTRVTAVEAAAGAHRNLEFNVPAATAIHATAEEFLRQLQEAPALILADPPRTGLGKHTVADLIRIRAPQLRIVSCDPATLARDLRALLAAGYRIEHLTLVDLFPQTFHLETVIRLLLA
jgi:23S rRNA (uracil1939-C5)-methyltransferase